MNECRRPWVCQAGMLHEDSGQKPLELGKLRWFSLFCCVKKQIFLVLEMCLQEEEDSAGSRKSFLHHCSPCTE